MNKFLGQVRRIVRGRSPGQLVIQYTTRCNAACPQCGMNTSKSIPRTTIESGLAKKMIRKAVKKDVTAISFTGGEPLLDWKEVFELLSYARDKGIPFTRTGTNGYIFRNSTSPDFRDRMKIMAQSVREAGIRNFWISIDSAVPGVHEKMRGLPGVIKGIEKALPIFHENGIWPSVNLGINRNTGGIIPELMERDALYDGPDQTGFRKDLFRRIFEDSFRKFYRFVHELGFTIANVCYPMNSESVYGATSDDLVVAFTREEKTELFKALYNILPEVRSMIRAFTPMCSLHELIRQYERDEIVYPCLGGVEYFFATTDGQTYPCGYRNDTTGKYADLPLNTDNKEAFCKECDWECFRDPSAMIGPLIQLFQSPAELVKRIGADPTFFKLLISDLAYYKKCDFFDGRKTPHKSFKTGSRSLRFTDEKLLT